MSLHVYFCFPCTWLKKLSPLGEDLPNPITKILPNHGLIQPGWVHFHINKSRDKNKMFLFFTSLFNTLTTCGMSGFREIKQTHHLLWQTENPFFVWMLCWWINHGTILGAYVRLFACSSEWPIWPRALPLGELWFPKHAAVHMEH